MWSALSTKLEVAAALGSRIKLRETEARVQEGSDAINEISRELLLKTCGTLNKCFRKLSRATQDANFEELCARVMGNTSTAVAEHPDAGISAPQGTQSSSSAKVSPSQRLVVPTGRKPLDLFDHQVWTKMDPVCFWYNDCVWGAPPHTSTYSYGGAPSNVHAARKS